MNKIFYVIAIGVAYGCAPSQTETTSADSTNVTADSVALVADNDDEIIEDAGMYDADPGEVVAAGVLNGDQYDMTDQIGFVSDPFAFYLDSATVQELLGEEAVFTSHYTPAGEDEMGPYPGYSFYEVDAGETAMSFYSYSGKHSAKIYTPKLELKYGIKVGMTRADFLAALELPEEAAQATTFTFNDDYGWMGFYFVEDTLRNIRVNYEEGD
jgi:hypothetical protein